LAAPDPSGPLVLARLRVLPSWIDYNGHMTEGRYLLACSEVTDALLRLIGADLAYVAAGRSYYTVETHVIHLGEAKAGDLLTGAVQVLGADDKRLHLFVTLSVDGRPVATLEQMLLHVDMAAGRTAPVDPAVLDRLRPIAAAQAALARPPGAGRRVGQARD
jgi:carnitine 3-dehydrogenase